MNASYAFMLLAVGADPANRALLLDDLRVLEGLVQSDAGIVRVTPPNGPPVVVKAAQVLFNGADREAVYAFLVERTDTKTAVGHARLANWCDQAGLSQRAAHAKSAAALSPTDTSLTAWAKALAEKASKPTTVTPVSATVPAPILPTVDLPHEARVGFGPKVQPILMNLCASCHATKGYAGTFALSRVSDGYANPEATAANLRSVAGQLDRADPMNSPLLRMTLTPHGGQKQPALAGREHPAFAHLQRWVAVAVPNSTQVTVASVPAPIPAPAKLPQMKAEPLPPAKPVPATPVVQAVATEVKSVPVKANDPFDPAKFHRLPAGK